MVQNSDIRDSKYVRFFYNFWMFVSCIIREFYDDNKNWILNKFGGKQKLF